MVLLLIAVLYINIVVSFLLSCKKCDIHNYILYLCKYRLYIYTCAYVCISLPVKKHRSSIACSNKTTCSPPKTPKTHPAPEGTSEVLNLGHCRSKNFQKTFLKGKIIDSLKMTCSFFLRLLSLGVAISEDQGNARLFNSVYTFLCISMRSFFCHAIFDGVLPCQRPTA